MTDPFADELLSFASSIHAVLDGAIVEDIEQYLKANDLVGRPLFRETMDREVLIAGPWMVSAGMDRAVLHRSVAAARDMGKGVFWLGDQGEDAMFSHLRKLNAARMPDGRILLFRHYDSDVLAAVAPLLGATQAAQLFGASRVLGFIGGEGDGLTIIKPDGLPDPVGGPIAIEQWQLEQMNQRQKRLDKGKICRALRTEYPEQTGHLSDTDLDRKISDYERSAHDLRLTSRSSVLNWARLNIENNDGASKDQKLRSDILSVPADFRNKAFLRDTPRLLEAARRARQQAAFEDAGPEGRLLS